MVSARSRDRGQLTANQKRAARIEARVVGASVAVGRHVGSRLLSAKAAIESGGDQDIDARMSRAFPSHSRAVVGRVVRKFRDHRRTKRHQKRWLRKYRPKRGVRATWKMWKKRDWLRRIPRSKERLRRASRQLKAAARPIGRAWRDAGQRDLDQQVVGASRSMMRRLRAPFRRAGGRLGRSAVRGSWRITRYGAAVTRRAADRIWQRAAWAGYNTAMRVVGAVNSTFTAVAAAASAAGAALPAILAIVAAVAALCALLPSFVTNAGIAEQKRQQQRTVCPANEAPQQSVTAEQVAEFLPRPGGVDRSGSLNEEQRQYATVIVEEGQKAGLPPRAWAIALMTALQESTLGADKSSFTPDVNHDVGIFQQRAVVGWYADGATEAENTEILNDISYAARTFYLGHEVAKDVWGGAGPKGYHIPGLVNIDNWENRDLGFVAQAVQKSAYPTAYSKHEATVATLLPTLSTRCSASAPGTSGLVDVDEYYPWWQSMGGLKAGYDPQGFAWAQCTSYVAFAIRTYSGYKDFQNNWKGQHFGNAKEWDAAARGAGIRVDQMPVVGAVAERSVGRWGHVAYIVAVNSDGTFVVNEYNHVTSRAFSSRTAKIGPGTEDFDKIIHFEAP